MVSLPRVSDHKVVILQIDFDKSLVKYPFKFNSIWLEDQQICNLVKEQWISLSQVHYTSAMFGLIDKLNNLKFEVQKWERLKKVKAKK